MSIVCVTLCVCMSLNLLHSYFAYRRCQHAQASFVNFHNPGLYPLQTKEVTHLICIYWVLVIQIQSVWLQCHLSLLLHRKHSIPKSKVLLHSENFTSFSKPSYRSGLGAMSTLYVIQVRSVPTWTCIIRDGKNG